MKSFPRHWYVLLPWATPFFCWYTLCTSWTVLWSSVFHLAASTPTFFCNVSSATVSNLHCNVWLFFCFLISLHIKCSMAGSILCHCAPYVIHGEELLHALFIYQPVFPDAAVLSNSSMSCHVDPLWSSPPWKNLKWSKLFFFYTSHTTVQNSKVENRKNMMQP